MDKKQSTEVHLLRIARDIVQNLYLEVINEVDSPAKALLSVANTALFEVVRVFDMNNKLLQNG